MCLYTNEKGFVVYEWWNGTFSDKPRSDLLVTSSVLTGYAQSNPDDPEYVPPSLENDTRTSSSPATSQLHHASNFIMLAGGTMHQAIDNDDNTDIDSDGWPRPAADWVPTGCSSRC